jgi:asparagine synthase (glutamine-hydrolysing)
MGNARLSIIGLDTGLQPIGNEDGSLWIVYNGEMFNYLELKEELIRAGHRFITGTDTEVVLHLYEEMGPACLNKINGQFAMAIWDTRRKELFLARDRLGIRPLFYSEEGGRFSFASEIKSLFLVPGVSRQIDPVALDEIFTFWTTLPPRTAFKGIQQLLPGHYLFVREGRVSHHQYWSLPYHGKDSKWAGSFEEAEEHLRFLLTDAVGLRLRADVPVGAYLSGGLDSSITTALISRNFNNCLKTFSMRFQADDFDETVFQEQLVKHLETDHCSITVSAQQIRECLPKVVWHCEMPLVRTAPVPLWLLSKLVREHKFKVVLTGEGADEIFGGYNIFKEAKVRSFWGRQPLSNLRPRLLEKLYPYVFENPARGRAFLYQFFAVQQGDLLNPLFSHQVRWRNGRRNTAFFSNSLRDQLGGTDSLEHVASRLPDDFSQRDLFSRTQTLETAIFLSNYLLSSQGDRVAMANSLEIRLPFLDFRVIEFAARLPARWKLRGLNEKYILKRTFGPMLPATIANRPKQPYRAPIQEAIFSDRTDSYVDNLLSEESIARFGYFHPGKVGHLVSRFRKGNAAVSETQNMALLAILTTQLTHQMFIEDFGKRQEKPAVLDRRVCESDLSFHSSQSTVRQ